MSYDKTKTFDRANKEMDKKIQGEEERTGAQRSEDKYWGGQFKDLVETVYIVMKDGDNFKISSQEGRKVNLDVGRLDEYLKGIKGKEYSVKDIDIVIHNHLKRPKFSPSDKKQYRRFKDFGFTGKFLMYSHLRKRTYEYKLDEKKNNEKK